MDYAAAISDGVFRPLFTGTAAEITPVREIDHRKIGRGECGPVSRALQDKFFGIVKGADDSHAEWLYPV